MRFVLVAMLLLSVSSAIMILATDRPDMSKIRLVRPKRGLNLYVNGVYCDKPVYTDSRVEYRLKPSTLCEVNWFGR